MKGSPSSNLQLQQQQTQDSGCKIFVGGLTWNTTKEMLHNEFSKFGEIVDSIVMKNPETGNSRGFGFVTYNENVSAENAVATGSHKVDGKIVDVKLCNPRLAAQQRNIKQKIDNCKVFVGGLPHGVTDEQIKQFFSRYGPVKEFKMMYDENKQRPRGFGFITFDSEESANQVLQEHYIQFNGKQIEVKPQIHNLRQQLPYQAQQMQFQPQNAHFSGTPTGSWNSQWNQPQQMSQNQPQMSMSGQMSNQNANYASMMQQGYSNNQGMNQQWGYPNQSVAYANSQEMNVQNAQSNWNYQYYGQPQQGYYQQNDQSMSGTGLPDPITKIEPLPIEPTLPFTPTPPNPTTPNPTQIKQQPIQQQQHTLLFQDAIFPHYKPSSTSSIAGTIGSNANYSDSEHSQSSHSFYRANSIGSNSSIAPSVSSLTSSSIISNISITSSNNSTTSTTSRASGLSNQNHHRINTQNPNLINPEMHRNHLYGHNRSCGSVASSSATDISSNNGSGVFNPNNMNDGMNYDDEYYSGMATGQQRLSSNYHPYRR